MTVLGAGNEKSGDKEQLVGKDDVSTIMPNRVRFVKLQRRRSLITLILSIGFIFIFLCGIFLTVCFIKRIGPFTRHYVGKCPVGSRRFNGQSKIFESYEVTEKYALIHVPKFNFKHGTFDSVRTLHVFDKKLTVIQHNGMCFVKPMMKFQLLRSDWFEKLRTLSHIHFRTPHRFAHYHLQIVHPQLPANYLRDQVHHMADAMCNSRPVFRLEFQIHPVHYPWLNKCNVSCPDCPKSEQVQTWKTVAGRKCKFCHCKKSSPVAINTQGPSDNGVNANCKTIRCENKCALRTDHSCVRCWCVDGEPVHVKDESVKSKPNIMKPLVRQVDDKPGMVNKGSKIVDDKLEHPKTFVNNGNSKNKSETQIFHERLVFQPNYDNAIQGRRKRSADVSCNVVAKIYEGYTPLDYDMKVPLDHIYDC